MTRITQSELARRLGVQPSAISRAVSSGRVTAGPDGLLDAAGATAQWLANRRRRPPRRLVDPASAGSPAVPPAAGGAPGARERRDLAEAEFAELRVAELRGELVRRAEVERELASLLVGMRDGLETLADRVAPTVAGESDAAACRRILRDEHRRVLAELVARVAAAPAPERQA